MIFNRGLKNALNAFIRSGASAYIALCTNDTAPNKDHNTLSELSQIATGNGYTSGGVAITLNSTDVDVLVEDDTLDKAYAQLKNIVFTASGGNLPASGNGARWAVLTDANVTVGSRELAWAWDLVSARTVSDTQSLTLIDCQIEYLETA